jgi:hypothetical protein
VQERTAQHRTAGHVTGLGNYSRQIALRTVHAAFLFMPSSFASFLLFFLLSLFTSSEYIILLGPYTFLSFLFISVYFSILHVSLFHLSSFQSFSHCISLYPVILFFIIPSFFFIFL